MAGEPVQRRLSLSGLLDGQLIRMAASLGVRRFSVSHHDNNYGMLTAATNFDNCTLIYKDPNIQYVTKML